MRFPELDLVRGIGILLVIVYHAFFDLYFFGINEWAFGLPVLLIGRLAAILLILISGISLSISISKWKGKKGELAHHAKHVLFLSAVALLITAATWTYPHEGFIFFGIIHFLTFATLIGLLLSRSQTALLIIALLSLPLWFIMQTQQTGDVLLSIFGFGTSIYTLDLFSIAPWLGVFCVGMLLGQREYTTDSRKFKTKQLPRNKLLEWMGRNSLAIYLVHQLVLIGLLLVLLQARTFF